MATKHASPGRNDSSDKHKPVPRAKRTAGGHKLEQSNDSGEFRASLISLCSADSTIRNEEDISSILHCMNQIGTFRFFKKYSVSQKRQIASIAQIKQAKSEEILFHQEAVPDALYLVISGQCLLFKMQGEGRKVLASAGPGDSVGDLSHLDERCRRSMTAQVVSENCDLISLKKQDLDSLVVQWRIEEEEEKTQFITRSVPVLQSVPRSFLEHLSPYFDRVKVPRDTVIYRQQDEATAIYFIWEGEVQLLKRVDLVKASRTKPGKGPESSSPSKGFKGEPSPVNIPDSTVKKVSKGIQISVLNSGEYFGEVEVFNSTLRSSAVVSVTDCTLLSLSKTSLSESMPNSFLDAVFRYSTMRLQWRNSRIRLIMDALANVGWVPERDPKLCLEPEMKPLAKMKSVLLPLMSESDNKIWLGVHTAMSPDDAMEWNMYHYGPWAQCPDKFERVKEDAGVPGGHRQNQKSVLPTTNVALEKSLQMLERRKAEILRASFFSLG